MNPHSTAAFKSARFGFLQAKRAAMSSSYASQAAMAYAQPLNEMYFSQTCSSKTTASSALQFYFSAMLHHDQT